MTRSTPEWIGANDDAKVPDRVRIRVFERCGGRCHISGRRIMAGELWDLDHVVALVNGGRHCESNLAPALRDKHREKTKADVAEKSRVARKRAKYLGIKTSRAKIQSAGFRKTASQRSASRPVDKWTALTRGDA